MLENVAIFPSELRPSRIGNSGSFHVSHQEDSKFKGFLFAVFYRTIWRRENKRFFLLYQMQLYGENHATSTVFSPNGMDDIRQPASSRRLNVLTKFNTKFLAVVVFSARGAGSTFKSRRRALKACTVLLVFFWSTRKRGKADSAGHL